MYDVVTFGEAMIRLSPPSFQRLEQTNSLEVRIGGAELNVAVAGSRLGLSTAWVSRLPRSPLGRMVAGKAREHGVDTSHILWTDSGRVGLYFVIYERNVTAEEVETFLRQVQRSLGQKLIVVMDRWAAHRKAAKALFGDKRFWIEWLPPYAPDLNPVDNLWGHTKHDDLANLIPDDLPDLERELEGSFDQTRGRPELLRSFFYAAELEI